MDKDYEYFTTIDFAIDEFFLRHYLDPTDQAEEWWSEWLARHPHKLADWNEARTLVEAVQLGLSDYARTFLSAEAEADLLCRILSTNKENDKSTGSPGVFGQKSWVRVAAAACFLLALFLGGTVLFKKPKAELNLYAQRVAGLQKELIETVNAERDARIFYLPDSTEVVLFPASRLSYSIDYLKENRTVYLSGQATFDVKKNPQKPFYVYANEIITKVLGTKFEVSAFDDGREVSVKVKSGQVSVYKSTEPDKAFNQLNAERKGVMLLPNQQVVFSRASEQFDKVLIEKPTLLPNHESQQFVYEEYPVVQVFEDLKNAYGIEIIKNDEVLKYCELTANLTDESLTQKLSIICGSIGATYEILDAQIIINSKGCKTE